MPGTLSQTPGTPATMTRGYPVEQGHHREQVHTLLVVSNRGPYEHHLDESGTLRMVRGQGGVITALSALPERHRVHWIAAAITEADRQVARDTAMGRPFVPHGMRLGLRLVALERESYQRYYNVFSNPFLWFLQHGLPSPDLPADVVQDAWSTGYAPANLAMARATCEEARLLESPPVIMLHDYHLYLVDGHLRAVLPRAIIQHFIHIPWPGPATWAQLPTHMLLSILHSLLSADIVGVHTRRDERNFLDTVEAFVPDARVDRESMAVYRGRWTTHLRAYPISIDITKLRREASSPEVRSYAAKLAALAGHQTIVRVDRLDPSKNVVRGFDAFELLLERRPDLHGKVRFLCFLVPSRTSIPVYQEYEREALEAAQRINRRYGQDGWMPIEVFHENNYLQSMAAMQLYDVLLVNPLADGMNLVSKEGPILNERDGVLILSRAAGSHEQLAAGALSIDPVDAVQTSRALETALEMPAPERRRRATLLKGAVEREDLAVWLDSQLADVDLIRLRRETSLPGTALDVARASRR